ncbi:MAG: DUF2793 domain-containing protein [Parasphingorhabdus sp.]|nr:DUF2793 domain-containing protein [Parasphingorhabdus sp.]
MLDLLTPRYKLPLLAVGQAQKELFHNEAIILLDYLAQPVVQSLAANPETLSPGDGDAWIVGASATGEFLGHDGEIALWTGGGWRFILCWQGMSVLREDLQALAVLTENGWESQPNIIDPTGGNVIDIEARTAVASILSALRAGKLIADI